MSLYPDNVPRATRVRQLGSDIGQLQAQIKESVEDIRKQDTATLEMLNTIAKEAGYKTLDEYAEAAAKQLTPEEKAAFDQMKNEVDKLDEDMAISHKVFRGLIAVGLVTKGIRIFALAFKETQSLLFGIQAVLKAIYYAILGAVESAAKFLTWGRVTLSLVSRVGGITTEAVQSMKFLRIGGSVMVGVGVVVDAALLIVEAIQGAKQREDLQNAIVQLCAHRFVVKGIQQQARAIVNFKSDAKSLVKMKSKYDGWVKKGRMTIEEVAEEMKPEMEKTETDLKGEMNKITEEGVLKMLDEQDTLSHIAWTDEDPDLNKMKKWIENHTDEKK